MDVFDYSEEFVIARDNYIIELEEILGHVEVNILSLVKADEAVFARAKLLRDLHSIKGTAGGYGLELVSTLSHKMEDHLVIRDSCDNQCVDRLLELKDVICDYIHAYQDKDHVLIKKIKNMCSHKSKDKSINGKDVNKRVLILESSRVAIKLYLSLLEPYNIEVAFTKDGYAGLGRLINENFDFVISSMNLPFVDGENLFNLIRKLKSPNIKTPFIFISSTKSKGFEGAQPDYFISKTELDVKLPEVLKKLYVAYRRDNDVQKAEFSHVMAVDDSEDIHFLLKNAFKPKKGIKLTKVTNPKDAIKVGEKVRPDLILLDLMMPELSGEQVFSKLKENPVLKDVPVFFLTGENSEKEIKRLKGLGAMGVFRKPFSPKSFAQRLIDQFSSIQKKLAS